MQPCTKCGKNNNSAYKQCQKCRDRNNRKAKRRRLRLKAAGNCTRCNRPSGTCQCSEKTTNRRIVRRETGVCGYCMAPSSGKSRCIECNKRDVSGNATRYRKYRIIVVKHYGGECVCCGENTEIFLAIDHINGKATPHHKRSRDASYYKWFIDNNFPAGFRILCNCCNYGVYRNNGICPGGETHKLSHSKMDIYQGCPI